jgi:3-dehydroquinate synthase
VEANTGFKLYTHGEAVAIGMHGAALISRYLDLCSDVTVDAVRTVLTQFGLPLTAKECRPDELMTFLARDKKSVGGTINWVLLNAIGKVTISGEVSETVVRQVLAELT